jgi:hypothetical protein
MKQVITKEFIKDLPNTIAETAEEYRKAFQKEIERRESALKRLEKLLES